MSAAVGGVCAAAPAIAAGAQDPPFLKPKQPAVSRERAYGVAGTQPLAERDGGRGPFHLSARQNGRWPPPAAGHDPRKAPEAFAPWRPLKNASADHPATMLPFGDQDAGGPAEQSVLMADEMKRRGVRREQVIVPGRGRGFGGMTRDREISAIYDLAVAFLRAAPLK